MLSDDGSFYSDEGDDEEDVALDDLEVGYIEKRKENNDTRLSCEILSTDNITHHMQDIIKEVTIVIQVSVIFSN